MKYTPIIGLEIHVELNTESKMFCQCPADYFGKEPNTCTCPVCLGLPGALPVPNKEAIERTMLLGKALNCQIQNEFKFDRKHYFYPDLPKGYQISQYDEPIATEGTLEIITESGKKSFGIIRVHLEEDTGKLTHSGDSSLVDFNRSGVPLVEIVTKPDFRNGDDVKAFLEELQVIVRYLGIANADMEKGDMRLEPNISVQLTSKMPNLPDYKVEVKNINSFKFAKKAIEYEIDRNIESLERGEIPIQETRGYDSSNGITVSQRVKEEAEDYRYFPEPDIPMFSFTDNELLVITKDLPELPAQKVERYTNEFGIKPKDAVILTRDILIASYFEEVVWLLESGSFPEISAKDISNAIINKKYPTTLIAKEFIEKVATDAKQISVDHSVLESVVQKVLEANTKAVEDYRSGKNPNAVMFLVGQVMKEMKGQADAVEVRKVIEASI